MRSADRPLLLLIVAAIVAGGLWGKGLITPNVAAQAEHRHAEGPQGDTVGNPASAAPITYWGTYKATAFVLYRSDGPLREFIVKFDLPDIPNREGWR